MSKNISIKVGGVSRNFSNVPKIQTEEAGTGDSIDWIPQDEANDYAITESARITENGAYHPSSGKCGFNEVVVNVSGGGGGTLIEKNITQNGDYYATDDNANGYSKVSVNIPSDIPTDYTIASWMTYEDWTDFKDLTNLEQYQNMRRGFLIIADSIITTYVYPSEVYNAEQIWDIRDVYDEGTILSVNTYNTYTKSHDGDAFGMSVWYKEFTGMILVSKESLDAVKYECRGHHVGKVLGVDSKGTTWYRSADTNYSGGHHSVSGGALPLHVPELVDADKLEDFLKLMICIHEDDFTLFSLMDT